MALDGGTTFGACLRCFSEGKALDAENGERSVAHQRVGHLGIPRDTDPDLLSEAEALFAPQAKPKKASKPKVAPALVKPAEKKVTAKKQKAA